MTNKTPNLSNNPSLQEIKVAIGAPLFNSKCIAWCLTDYNLNFVSVNEAFCEATEYSKQELIGTNINVLLGTTGLTDDFTTFSYLLNASTESPSKQSWYFYTKKGECRRAYIEFSRISIDQQPYVLTIAHDISSEYEPENMLQKESRWLKILAKTPRFGTWEADLTQNDSFTNNDLWRMLGYAQPETKRISHFIQRIIHPDDQEKISKELSRIKHSGSKTFDTLLRFKASDGTYRWIRALGVVLKQNNQRLVERLIGIYIDMTSEIQATQKLNRTKELLEIAEQLIAVGSFELNLNTNKIQWTKGMYQIWEVPVDENPPSCEFLKSYISEEDIKRIGASIEECKRTGTPTDLVYHIYMPDGLKKTIHAVYKTSEKAPAWIFGTLRDITEAQAAQKQLIASEKNYRLLTETIPHIVWRMDPQGNVLYINKYGQNFFGRSHNESKPWKVRDYTSQEDYDRINSIFEEISEKKIPFQHSLKIRHKNGNYYWFQVLLTPHLNNDQEIESWTAVANNIHEQVEAQRSLLQANRRMRSLIDASPVAIYSISVDGIVKNLWNPAAEQLLGWKREEVLGKFIPHVGDNIEDFRAALNEVLTTGQTQRTLKRIKKNGEEVILEANGGAVFDEHGKVEEILVTVMDITELITKREQLQESLKEKNTLLQEIHHRVKNNLAIVVGLLQLQAYQSNIPSEKNHLIDAQNRIKSIAMVHELLYSTEEFSKVNLRTYYQRLVDSIRSNMHIHAREIQQTLAINIESLNITQAIPLGLLINELLTNSLKYAFPNPSPNDHIHLLINKQDTTIYVEYWDNGIGFSMTSSHFKPGLGFKIMDSLLQQLEAEYELEAEEGFRIRFQFQEKLPD